MIAPLAVAVLAAGDTVPAWRMELSSIFGSISFACYLILMVPQLVEQWRLKTVDGVSGMFLTIWLVGDIANFVGSIWAGLLPEVILISVWFLVADVVTVAFYFYIKVFFDNKRKSLNHPNIHLHYDSLSPDHPVEHAVRRRHSSNTLEDILYQPEDQSIFVKYVLPLMFVIFAGVFGSVLSPNGSAPSVLLENPDTFGPQFFGYLSAVLYLLARLPQIHKNWANKSTDGLSLLFFMLTLLGNVTYTLQIITFRSDWEYIKLNFSWLLGSAGTIVQDIIILLQFHLYKNRHHDIIALNSGNEENQSLV